MKKLIIIILVIALILFGIKYYNLDNELMKKIYVKNYCSSKKTKLAQFKIV